ncbi:MAG: hypothetical protein ACI8TX_003290 [Hyphomicrobiaceae bacterium]
MEDPRVRLRTGGKIYERKLERVTDKDLIVKIRTRLAERYNLERNSTDTDTDLWLFHVAPR